VCSFTLTGSDLGFFRRSSMAEVPHHGDPDGSLSISPNTSLQGTLEAGAPSKTASSRPARS
jgi:hypothetical protein